MFRETRIIKVSWLSSLGENNRRKQSTLFGHVLRRKRLEYVMSTGTLRRGSRGMGRTKETLLKILALWHVRIFESDMIGCTWNKKLWTHMITNSSWYICKIGEAM